MSIKVNGVDIMEARKLEELRRIREALEKQGRGVMDKRFKQRDQQRYAVLRAMYEKADGQAGVTVDFGAIAFENGLSAEAIGEAIDFLTAERLVKRTTGLGNEALTHEGVKEVEASIARPQEQTHHFQPSVINNYNTFNGPVGSVQSGAHSVAHVTQNVATDNSVKTLIQELHQHAQQLPPAQREEATELVAELEKQTDAEKPKRSVLSALLTGLQALFLSAPAAQVVAAIMKKVLHQ